VPECPNAKEKLNGELDRYDHEHFEVQPFDTTGLEMVDGVMVTYIRTACHSYITGLISQISGCFCFLLLNGFLFSSNFIYFLVYAAVR